MLGGCYLNRIQSHPAGEQDRRLTWFRPRRVVDDRSAVAVDHPLIIVEVLSPSTCAIDRTFKLREYFRLPSLRHYLIVRADKQQIVHHQRGDDGAIETQIVTAGAIRLEPPGISIAVEAIYDG